MLGHVIAFLEVGGAAMVGLLLITFVMWALLLDAIFYLRFFERSEAEAVQEHWSRRPEHLSWNASQIRRMLISQHRQRLDWSFPIIKACVALCPMIGLLGTVVGMIEIFSVMTVGSGASTRGLAMGVSKAMTTTAAGMVAALSGMITQAFVVRLAADRLLRFESTLDDAIEPAPRLSQPRRQRSSGSGELVAAAESV